MTSVIWKFTIPAEGKFTLELPDGPCQPLAVQMQRDVATLWVLVSAEENAPKKKGAFFIVATGQPFSDDGLSYVGTFQPSSNLVFHLFQAKA